MDLRHMPLEALYTVHAGNMQNKAWPKCSGLHKVALAVTKQRVSTRVPSQQLTSGASDAAAEQNTHGNGTMLSCAFGWQRLDGNPHTTAEPGNIATEHVRVVWCGTPQVSSGDSKVNNDAYCVAKQYLQSTTLYS